MTSVPIRLKGSLVSGAKCAHRCWRACSCLMPHYPVSKKIGTLKAAKKRKVVSFDGELLLSPVHDNTNIVLLKDSL